MALTIDKDGRIIKGHCTKPFEVIQTERQQEKARGQVVDTPCGVEIPAKVPNKLTNLILPPKGGSDENV